MASPTGGDYSTDLVPATNEPICQVVRSTAADVDANRESLAADIPLAADHFRDFAAAARSLEVG